MFINQRLSTFRRTRGKSHPYILAICLSTAAVVSRNRFGAHAFSPIVQEFVLRSNKEASSQICSETSSLQCSPQWMASSMRKFSLKKETKIHSSKNGFADDYVYDENNINFRRGDKIQVEITKFGRLGASVEVISHNSHEEEDIIPESEPALGFGLILQKEIHYFREARNGLDVITGEILPAYVEKVRDDGKLDISFRIPGGKGKAEDLANIILETLKSSKNKEIAVGDKSTPEAINRMFPGSSKASFKRAVAFLYKKKLVQPGPETTSLM